MDDYDEVITDNPFYKAFQNKAKSLYNLAAEKRWLICIPRTGVTNRSQYTQQQFETHVLMKADENDDCLYQTHNGKMVRVTGDFIATVKGFSDVRTVKVLFEETFFNPQAESYHVLCISQLLEGGAFRVATEPVIPNLETLQNCTDFLWNGTGSRKSRKKIDDVVELFNSTYKRLETESIRHAMDAANAVFTRAMQTALKEPHLRRPADGSKPFMDSLKVAIETYVMHGLYRRTFKGLSSFLATKDAELNKITRNLADLQVKDLGIKQQLCKNIPRAKKILSNLNRFSTPLEKINVLKLTVTCVSEVQDISDAITADDLLPVLVFLVIKSEIPNWLANLTYMYNFHFSKYKNDEFQFYLSSIEAAMEYVRTGKLNHLIGLSHSQRQNSIERLFQRLDSTERQQGPSPVDVLFEEIRNGNIENVKKMLNKGIAADTPLNEQLCHPLCSCDSCEKLLASKRNDPMAVTVFSRDDMGSTVLHPAAEFDQEFLLFELINNGAVVNATNYHGSTPLHLACLRGHKKPAIMLIHYGGSINASDNDGNTPIHLATANGHEKVAEALMFVNNHHTEGLKINAANDHGDTPLHIASRWGFTNLVRLLLDHGASLEARNKNKESPLDCAANLKVQELLLNAKRNEQEEQTYIYVQPAESSDGISSVFSGGVFQSPKSPIASPKTKRRIKEFDNLLKVVGDGDLAMVKMRLGISDDDEETDGGIVERNDEALCHPLCQCSKCTGQQRTVSESVMQQVNMTNEDGVTCLHTASLRGYDRIVSLLLKQCGASANCRTRKSFKTPLHLACQYNHVECVSLLLTHGAKPDTKDWLGNTPLHFCCANGHISPAILLLQNEASVNISNKRGNTPLHESARWNCPDLVTLLLHYGASIEIKNKSNLTCLQCAQHDDVIDILREAEATANETPEAKTFQGHNLSSSKTYWSSTPSLFTDDLTISNDVFHQVIDSDSGIFQHGDKEGLQRKEKVSVRSNQRGTSIANLFEAYEEDDKEKVKKLIEGIQKFDKKKKLRRVSTIDRSEPTFDLHLIQMLSIKHFDISSLHHVDVRNNRSLTSTQSDVDQQGHEANSLSSSFKGIEHFESMDREMSEVCREKTNDIQTALLEQQLPAGRSGNDSTDLVNSEDLLKSIEKEQSNLAENLTGFGEEKLSINENKGLQGNLLSTKVYDCSSKLGLVEGDAIVCTGSLLENVMPNKSEVTGLTGPHIQEGLSDLSFDMKYPMDNGSPLESAESHGEVLGNEFRTNCNLRNHGGFYSGESCEDKDSYNEDEVNGMEANGKSFETDIVVDGNSFEKTIQFDSKIVSDCTNERPSEMEEEIIKRNEYTINADCFKIEDRLNGKHN